MAKYTNIDKLFNKINKNLDDVRTEFYLGLVQELVMNSYDATDTGAYMASHNVGTDTRSAGFTSKEGQFKARNVDKALVADQALERLRGEVMAIPDDATRVFIANRSPHSKAVEDGGWNWLRDGYHVFARTRREAKNILDAAVVKVKGESQ